MHALFVVSLWIHILAATTWIGGSVFLVLVLVPVLRNPEWRDRGLELIRHTARRFLWVVWTCFALLIVTGVFNLLVHGGGDLSFLATGEFWSSAYGHVLAWKLTFVGSILLLSALHDFVLGPVATRAGRAGAPGASRLRLAVRWAGRLNLLLGLLVVGLGVALGRGWPW
jgi:putative copper resistance protein D